MSAAGRSLRARIRQVNSEQADDLRIVQTASDDLKHRSFSTQLRNISVARLIGLDVGRPDHLAPSLGFVRDEFPKRGRCHRHRVNTQAGKPRLDEGICRNVVNPAFATLTEITLRDVDAAAPAMGLQIQVLNADTSREIDAAFEIIDRERPDALFVGPGPFFNSRRVQMAQLAARYALPATYTTRLEAEAGGLMSYGPSVTDAYRQVGIYTGRILKGAKPEDLPVVQSSKFELVINAQTARMLRLTVPPTLLAIADEVIE